MIISTEELLQKVNETKKEKIGVILGNDSPSIATAGEIFKNAGINVFYRRISYKKESLIELNNLSNDLSKHKDLILMLGIYLFNKDFKNNPKNIFLSDSLSYNIYNHQTYIVNKNDLGWDGIKTSSYAQTAYEIIKYLDKEDKIGKSIRINGKKINLELALMLSDWKDNTENEQTQFQKIMAEKLELKDKIPNLLTPLKEYAFFDFSPAIEHYDFKFKYSKKNLGIDHEITSRIPKEEFIIENPQKKLEEIISEDKSFENFIYFPSINGNSLATTFENIFYPKWSINNLRRVMEEEIEDYYNKKISLNEINGQHPITGKNTKLNVFILNDVSHLPTRYYNLLLLFNRDSILIPYNVDSSMRSSIFTKADVHAGMIAQIGAAMKYKNYKQGVGSGGRYKGYAVRLDIKHPFTYIFGIKDLFEKPKGPSSLFHLASYISIMDGKKVGVEIDNTHEIYLPPYVSPNYQRKTDEFENCDIIIKNGEIIRR